MTGMPEPQRIDVSAAEMEALIARAEHGQLTHDEQILCAKVLRFTHWLQHSLTESKLSIKRLLKLFGFKTEKKRI